MKKVIKALDRDADGVLDSINSGIYDLVKLQKEYSNFIKTRIGKNRIITICI
jgi:mRNA-degrading endonuclease RelE of RelBE toxin-antitoxin system